MNKSQLIDAMADSAEISKTTARKALDGVMESVTRALENSDNVSLIGFGTFLVVHRAARKDCTQASDPMPMEKAA